MRKKELVIGCIGSAFACLAGGPAMAASATPDVALPSFYADSAKAAAAGRWLDSEPLPAERGLAGAERQIRFTYSSTDGLDGISIVTVSGALFLPQGRKPRGGWPIVAWAHGTVGIADGCAPSLAGRSARDREYLGKWLDAGFAIVATDYQGLGTPGVHPYLHSRAAAYSVLDSVRAVRAHLVELGEEVIIVGQSQGAGAALAAAGLASDYAPDLRIVGTVATGVPNIAGGSPGPAAKPDPKASADRTMAYAMYLAASVDSLRPKEARTDAISAQARPVYEAAHRLCLADLFEKAIEAGLNSANTITPAFVRAYGSAFLASRYPTLAFRRPVFIGIGEADVDTATGGQLALVRDACAAGATIEAHLYAGRDHSGAVNRAFPDALRFARALLKGDVPRPRCAPMPE